MHCRCNSNVSSTHVIKKRSGLSSRTKNKLIKRSNFLLISTVDSGKPSGVASVRYYFPLKFSTRVQTRLAQLHSSVHMHLKFHVMFANELNIHDGDETTVSLSMSARFPIDFHSGMHRSTFSKKGPSLPLIHRCSSLTWNVGKPMGNGVWGGWIPLELMHRDFGPGPFCIIHWNRFISGLCSNSFALRLVRDSRIPFWRYGDYLIIHVDEVLLSDDISLYHRVGAFRRKTSIMRNAMINNGETGRRCHVGARQH